MNRITSKIISAWKNALGDYNYREYQDADSIHRLLPYTISQVYYKSKKLYKILFCPFEYNSLKRSVYVSDDNDMIVYGFYHIFCATGWTELVKDQVAELRNSGLLRRTNKLYVSCITQNENDLDVIKDIIGRDKCEIVAVSNNDSAYEYPALDAMQEKAKISNRFFAYYFHTKGISYYWASREQNPNKDSLILCGFAWRKYYCFVHYKIAIRALKQGYDCYGVYYKNYRDRHFAGNFWWADSEYLKKLPTISERERKDRLKAESWIGRNKHKAFVPFNTSAELYAINIGNLYKKGRVKDKIIFYLKSLNYYFKEKH